MGAVALFLPCCSLIPPPPPGGGGRAGPGWSERRPRWIFLPVTNLLWFYGSALDVKLVLFDDLLETIPVPDWDPVAVFGSICIEAG